MSAILNKPFNHLGPGPQSGSLKERIDAIERHQRLRIHQYSDPGRWSKLPYFQEATLELDFGVWSVSETIDVSTDSVKIFGSGGHSVLEASASDPGTVMNISADAVILSGIKFRNTSALSGSLLNITGQFVYISNCVFEGFGRMNCINANLADNLTIKDCFFLSGDLNAVYILDSDNSVVNDNRMMFPPTFVGPVTDNAVFLASTNTAVAAQRCNDAIVANNHIGTEVIRYNTTGAHQITGNNAASTATAY